jgi:type II secretory pathway predicted ATPase ExeA
MDMTDNDRAKRRVLILGTAGGGKTVVLRSPVLDAVAQSMPVFAPAPDAFDADARLREALAADDRLNDPRNN